MKFVTIEEAQAAYDKLVIESKEFAAKISKDLEETKAILISTQNQLKEVEEVAKDAIAKVNDQSLTEDITFTFEKKKYKVNFGVDGRSINDIAEDKDLIKKLVKNGSNAISVVEG